MGGQRLGEILRAAETDRASVQALTADLVRVASRGGIDPYEPVLDRLAGWLERRGLPVRKSAAVCTAL